MTTSNNENQCVKNDNENSEKLDVLMIILLMKKTIEENLKAKTNNEMTTMK
jgi:hypothetical protein